jgi:hypothetical protein
MKWLKMGCGHLVAVPLLLVCTGATWFFSSGLVKGLFLGGELSMGGVIGTFAAAVVTGGIGGGLLYYLWGTVWPAEHEAYTADASEARPGTAPGAAEEPANGARSQVRPWEQMSVPQPDLSQYERPWTVRDAWSDGRVSSSQGSLGNSGTTLVGFGVGVLLVGAIIAAFVTPWFIGAVFVVGGGILTGKGAYRLLRRRRYGTTPLDMATVPGELGGRLCGVLHTGVPADDAPDDGFRVKLTCYLQQSAAGEDSGGPSHFILWRDEKQIKGRRSADGTTLDVPMGFEVPSGPPPSTPEAKSTRVLWAVEISAALPGIDYSATLEIPVFPVEPDPSVDLARFERNDIEYDPAEPDSEGITLRRPSSGRIDLRIGWGRHPWQAAFRTVLFLLMVGGGGAGLVYFWMGEIPVGAALAGLAFAVAGIALGGHAYRYWTHHSRVVIDRDGIQVREGPLGLERSTHFPPSALEETRLSPTYEGHYDLHLVHSASGGQDEVVAARMLSRHLEAEWLASTIETAAARRARYT